MNRRGFPILIAAGTLLIATLACGSSNTGEKVGSTQTGSQPAATQAPAKMQTYKAGEVVEVQGYTIVLTSTKVQSGTLVANFSVNNPGSKEIAVSSMLSFEAKDGEGTKLEQDIVDCPSGGLDGKVLAGDKLKGNICWKAPAGATGIRIYYTASLLGSGAVVWELGSAADEQTAAAQPTKEPAATPASAPNGQGQRYKIGDVVKVEDHTIVLNSAKVQGSTLVANFTIDNQGSKEVAVSSMLSFEAKDSEGTKLEQDIVDCPSGGLDGKVLAGDKLKGNICWKAPAGATGIRVYYTASLLGSGAVVWELQ